MRRPVPARASAATALVAALALFTASIDALLHVLTEHDVVCETLVSPHDPSAHRMRAATSDEAPPLHCLACHWARSLRTNQAVNGPAVHDDGGTLHVQPASVRLITAPARTHLPARSPPSIA